MQTIKKVIIEPVFLEGYMMPDTEMQENKIYISEQYKIAIHKCLCGCGQPTVMPLNKTGWKLIKEKNETVSFTPSIGNYQFECKSHYIITKNTANFV